MIPLSAPLLGATVLGGVIALERWNQKRIATEQRKQVRYFRIGPHASTTVDGIKIMRMMEQFAGFRRPDAERIRKGREWFRFLIHKDTRGHIAFYIGHPEDRTTGITKALKGAYPEIELHEVRHEHVPLPDESKGTGHGGFFEYRRKGAREGLPLRQFDSRTDVLPDILFNLDASEIGTNVWLDVVFSPSTQKHLKKVVKTAEQAIRPTPKESKSHLLLEEIKRELKEELTGSKQRSQIKHRENKPPSVSDLDSDEQVRLKSLRSRFTGRESVFDVSVSLFVDGKDSKSILQTAATTVTSTLRYDNEIRFVSTKKTSISNIAPQPRYTMLWTGEELSNLVHLPHGAHPIYQAIPHLAKGQKSLRPGEMDEGIAVGSLKHPFQDKRIVKIDFEQFTKHALLTGMTGTGKSSTLMQATQSLIDNWIDDPDAPGFSFIDPARTTVATILSRLLKAEMDGKKFDWSKVHYVYLGDTDYPIGLNVLHSFSKENGTDGIVSDFLALMKTAYAGDTPQMDRLVRAAMATLIEDPEQHSILGIVPLLQDKEFRTRIVARVRDPILKRFWTKDFKRFEDNIDQAVSPILNRLSPFINNLTMRRMFGQPEWNIPLKKYMDDGHIFLIDTLNVKKENIKLCVGHLVNQYYYTSKTRPPGSKEHILIIDEGHDIQIAVLAKILYECRKFGLCLFMSTQGVWQFDKDLQLAFEEMVGTVLTCTQGAKSASIIQTITAGEFEKDYLQKLPERTVAVYTKSKVRTAGGDERSELRTFTVESDPPYIYMSDGLKADYRNKIEMESAVSWAIAKGMELQKRDGKHYQIVDEEIQEYIETDTIFGMDDIDWEG